jgi:hypothetical protein
VDIKEEDEYGRPNQLQLLKGLNSIERIRGSALLAFDKDLQA